MLVVDQRPRPLTAAQSIGVVLGNQKRVKLARPAGPVDVEDILSLAGLPCLSRKPKSMPFSDWINDTLVRCRGVLGALPRNVWPASATEADTTVGRIVAMDAVRAIGRSWWWLWRLHSSEYQQKTAYTIDDWTCVYHTDGLEAAENEWLPANTDYDALVLQEGFDRITLAGFAVTVRYVPPPPKGAAGTLDKMPALHQRMLLELEAAATGCGPAVLAMMLVHSNDKYALYEATGVAAKQDTSSIPVLQGDPGHVAACVTVTQTHSFRLGDLLAAYNKTQADPMLRPSLPSINGSIYEMTMAIARRVRALAKNRILKLNMTPDTIVFCPHLVEDAETGELLSQGYGYEGMETVRGVPYMWDFDPVYTKRVSSQSTDYDPDCAYVTMMLVLLASVKAQYGETVTNLMIFKLIGYSVDGKPLAPDSSELPLDFSEYSLSISGIRLREKASVFCTVLRSVLPVFAKEHEPTLGVAYVDMAKDFAEIVRSGVLSYWLLNPEKATFDRSRSIFGGLVRYLSASSSADTSVFNVSSTSSMAESLAERERSHRVEERLRMVQAIRLERMRES